MQESQLKREAHQSESFKSSRVQNNLETGILRLRKKFEEEVLRGKLLEIIIENKLHFEEVKLILVKKDEKKIRVTIRWKLKTRENVK
jgi:hypothetical protein